MPTIRYKQRFSKWYVYELHQYWDKELKKPRQRTTYLGVAEQKDGPYLKPGLQKEQVKKIEKTEKAIVDCGDSYAIDQISKTIGLRQIIADSFGNIDTLMALICFQISEGVALYHCQDWIEGNYEKTLFPEAKVTSQAISNLIRKLGQQASQNKFFEKYIAHFFPAKRGLLIDSTALPSAINSSMNAYGYANGSIQENVTCLMLVDEQSKLPIYFRAIGGDIPDVATLKTTLAEIKQLGLVSQSAILDAGFCSKENIVFLCQEGINFITRLPRSHGVFDQLVKEAAEMERTQNAIRYKDRAVFVKSKKIKLYQQEVYAHIVLDPTKKSKDMQLILQNGLEHIVTNQQELELDEKLKNAGYFILLSSGEIKKEEILPSYYIRQSIEQVFGFAKSNTNLLPLRVHDEQSIKGYLMLIFLALIIFITIRDRVKQPMDKVLLILRAFKAKIFDDLIIVQEPNKKIKEIFNDLKIIMPTVMGI